MSMTAAPTVSIVMPCYARSERDLQLLDETLATVDAQTCQDYEVIVVDDGSPLAVDGVARRHDRVQLLRQHNLGSALARNAGIARAGGKFLVFLDSDDHLLPLALESGLHHLAQRPECGFAVGPREEMTYEGERVPWDVPLPPRQSHIYVQLLAFDWYIIPPSSAMFRRQVVEQVGGFRDPWGADDLDFYLRAAWASQACCYQSPAVTRYRRYSTSSSRDGERMLRSIGAVYARQWPLVAGDPAAERAFHSGLEKLTAIFTDCVVENLEDRVRARQWRRAARSAAVLGRRRPARLMPALLRTIRTEVTRSKQ